MKTYKQIYLLIACLISVSLYAQQTPLSTQFMHNPFVLNPALAGTHNYYQIRSNNRFQWTGISDSPITNTLSIYGPHSSKNMDMGFGGFIYNDVTGPTSQTSINGAYAYNLAINTDIRVSGGLAIGLLQFKIDGTKISTQDEVDPVLQDGIYTTYSPDATVGVYVYSSNFHVGFSAIHLIPSKLNTNEATGLSKLKSHFFLTGGYKYFINRDFAIEPSILIKAVSPAPIQVDFNTKVIYQGTFWGGLSFRSMDAASIMVGYIHEKKIYAGYSYDLGISAFRTYHTGSHELMIGYRFNSLK